MKFMLLLSFLFSLGFEAFAGFNESGKVVTEIVLANYAQIKTVDDFVEHFAKSLTAEEKAYVRKTLSSLKTLPKFSRSREGFIVSVEKAKLYVDLTLLQQGKIGINGNTFFIHKSIPIKVQVDMIMDKLEQRSQKFSLMELFISQAFAVGEALVKPAVEAAATAATAAVKESSSAMNTAKIVVGSGVVSTVINRGLDIGVGQANEKLSREAKAKRCDEALELDPEAYAHNAKFQDCEAYAKAKQEALKKDPTIEAVKNNSTTANVDDKFLTKSERCSFETPDHSYYGLAQVMREKPDGTKSEDLVRLVGVYEKDKVKEVKVYDIHGTTVKATFKVNDKELLEEIILPKDQIDEKSKVANSKAPDIKVGATDQIKDDPVLKSDVNYYKGIYAYFGKRHGVCNTKKQEQEAAKVAQKPTSTASATRSSGQR